MCGKREGMNQELEKRIVSLFSNLIDEVREFKFKIKQIIIISLKSQCLKIYYFWRQQTK